MIIPDIPKSALAFAEDISKKAGRIQKKSFRKNFSVSLKEARNPVTEVDVKCEALIVNAIKKHFIT